MEDFQRREDILQDAIDLLNNEQFDECVAITRTLMAQHLPRSQAIYCHTLLASALEDWYEGENHRYAAECLYDNYRFFWPPGESALLDADMDELRGTLDQLREQQKGERPDDYAGNFDFKLAMYRKWSGTMKAEGEWAAELRATTNERQADIIEPDDEVLQAEFAEGQMENEAKLAEGDQEEEAELAEAQHEEQAKLAEREQEVQTERAEVQMEHEAELAEGDMEALADQHDPFSDVLNVTDPAALYQTADELMVEFKSQIKDVTAEHQEQAEAVGGKQEDLASKAPNRSAKGKQQVLQPLGDRLHQPCVRNRNISLGQGPNVNVEVRIFSASGHPEAQRHTTSDAASMKPRYAYDGLKSLQSHNLNSPDHNSPGRSSLGRNTMVRSPSRSTRRSKIPLSLWQRDPKANLQSDADSMHSDRTSILGMNWSKTSTHVFGRVRGKASQGESRKK